jgi:dTDP-4-dehydrorhamnose reductase
LLAAWSRSENRPFVHVSTDHFFVDGGAEKHGEQEPVTLLNEYARTKYAGERLALAAPLALVLRTNVVGIRGWKSPTFAEWAISCIEQGETMTLFEDAFVSSIDVRAFARAALHLVERGATGLLNVASRQVFTKGQFIRALAEKLGKPLAEARSGSVGNLQPRRAASLGLDVSAAERLLGYDLPDMQTVAASVVGQYRERQHP